MNVITNWPSVIAKKFILGGLYMPTISSSEVTYIRYQDVETELQKALDSEKNTTIARIIVEFGLATVVAALIPILEKDINKTFATSTSVIYSLATLATEIREALEDDEDKLSDYLQELANTKNKNYALRIETTYSEWISGSGNHSCNYQVTHDYSIVLYI